MNVRAVAVLVVAAIALFIGGWIHAKYELVGRVSEFAKMTKSVCASRGTDAPEPTREQIAGRLRAMADQVELTVTDVEVSSRLLDRGTTVGLDGMVQQQLKAVTGGKLEIRGVLLDVRVRVAGEKWLWSIDREVESTCTVRREMKRMGNKRSRRTASDIRTRTRQIYDSRSNRYNEPR
jgi:hypothetical protein